MRSIIAIAVIAMLASCATRESAPTVAEDIPVTYYDRNGDGKVDFEFHGPVCCDRDWALVDLNFDGRYDKRVNWGYALTRYKIDIPVPTDVPISSGSPPYSGWDD